MISSLKSYLAQFLQALLNFLAKILTSLLETFWGALAKVFDGLFKLLGTLWGRLLSTLTLLVSIALSPLVDFVKAAIGDFVASLGASPDVISSLFPSNFQALCYVAVNFCALDIMLSSLVSFLIVKSACYSIIVSVWAARKTASVVRGAGV